MKISIADMPSNASRLHIVNAALKTALDQMTRGRVDLARNGIEQAIVVLDHELGIAPKAGAS